MWDSPWEDIKMIVKYLESEYGIAIGAKISEVGDVKWDEFAPIGQFFATFHVQILHRAG